MVQRNDQINDRQADLLERIADGDDLSKPEAVSQRASARALQARGLITISKRKGVFTASVTDVGRYYLEHGYHPEAERSWSSFSDTAEAEDLIQRLRQSPDETVRVAEPDDRTRAAYRRAVDAARQGRLVPQGRTLRYTGRSSGDIVVRLLDADGYDDADWYRIRQTARKAKAQKRTFPAQDLRQLLTENPAALQVSDEQRERAVRLLLELNTASAKHDQEVRLTRRGEYATLGYRIGTEQWNLTLAEEYVNSYGRPANAWDIKSRYSSAEPTGKLQLRIGAPGYSSTASTWVDEKRSPLERRIRQVVAEVKARFAESERRAEEAYRKRLAEIAEEERKRAEERRQWDAAMASARPLAEATLRRQTLIAALRAWRDARDLREITNVLDDAASAADREGDAVLAENLRNWCAGGRELANRLDPTTGSASLGNVAFDIEPGADDLRPFLNGWSPDGPRRDNPRKSVEQLRLSEPWPSDWELGTLPWRT
ncbi:hypothetical protein IU500_17490 [Nocardia terpenica]|uniref:hypothetical protein n=1 Tax=Nocardia terpenica TaxID=455432 RepID=UPI001893FF09|nr:hypothetical protein [Nocardia terpenica]MBF6063279.1 hypothetical protein [Nocardia terpenica]MBF6105835.1 hypothetical protein [Nocardia terpenica]MBF6113581.1 hypothetical protein [Nocardia terpenica]MBF6119576.1 hypothetical protein [Nocardia terpenica]MBF6151987.1 hypothetical protein [Nocardia terpenica]